MKKFIPLFLLIISISFVFSTPVFAFDKTETGIISVENLPQITDEEFLKTPVRMEIFVKSWCQYCKELEKSMINAIYSKYTKNQVAIRLLDGEHPEVERYYENYTNLFDMPENMKGRVPTIIINGKYLIVGYGGEEMNTAMLEGIDQLLKENELYVLKTFSLKEEFKEKTDNLIYQYKKEETGFNNNEYKNNISNESKTEKTSDKEQIKSSPFADNISFFAVQGLYDTINNPIFAYMLSVFLFFIAYNKRKSLAFSGLYILGMIGANIIARFYNTGLYVYRQPILIVLSLVFAYLSLSIFWDILFTTYNKNDKVNIKYSRSLILNSLQKFLNSKISYLFAFVFAFAVYFFTTTYDLSYGVIITTDGRFNTALKVLLLIINGICASVLSVFLSMVVQAGKKMSHELIEPLKKYRLNYFGAIFYAALTFMLIYGIFKMYYYVN